MPSPFRTKKANAAAGTRREARDTARTPANGVGGAHAEPRVTVYQAHQGPIPPSTLSWWEEMETEQLFDGEIACRQAPAKQNFINCFRLQTVHPQLPWPPSSPFIPVSESHYLSLPLSISPSLHSCPTVPPTFYLSIIRPSIPVPPSFHPLFFNSSILLSLSSVLQFSHPSFPSILPSLRFPLLVSFPGIQRAAHQGTSN